MRFGHVAGGIREEAGAEFRERGIVDGIHGTRVAAGSFGDLEDAVLVKRTEDLFALVAVAAEEAFDGRRGRFRRRW
jgi:hypothetical protein